MAISPWRAMDMARTLLLSLALLGVAAATALAQQVVAPNSLATVAGDVDDAFPFFSSGIRYQQVYDHTQFSTLAGPMLLTQIAFRPFGGNTGPFSTTIPNIQIDFSTTAASSTSLSSTFASNVGANDLTVYSGSLTLSSAQTFLPDGTTDFDVVIPFKTPFLYDPTKGNLLMDVRDPEGPALPGFALDATSSATNGVARVFSDEGSPDSATGTVDNGSINDAGLVTRFTFAGLAASAPEPGSLGLLLGGLLCTLAGFILRRRRTAVALAGAACTLLLSLAPRPAVAQVSVLTQHYDNLRTGANRSETTLTLSNVGVTTFGKLFTRSLDANVNGQVLYVPNLTIGGAVHNVIIASTSNNVNFSPSSLYAFDADDPAASQPLWRHQLPTSARWTTCTPVIDVANNTIYVLTKETNDAGLTKLHAMDLLTGNERPGSPVTIAATIVGKGDGSVNQKLSFNTRQANCRPGLLLTGGRVYLAFAHNSDSFPYHGWVFGYSYNGTGFTRTAVFCASRNGGLAGIWMAGMGLTSDDAGNIFCTVGNGTFTANAGGSSYGMCVLKLRASDLVVTDWFAPFDEKGTSNADLDLGSVGIIGIPSTNRLFTGATKAGSCFLLDSTHLGRFTATKPDHIVQRFDKVAGFVGQNPVVWDAGTFKYVYLWPQTANIEQFRYDTALGKMNPAGFNTHTTNRTAGGSLTVSSNGNINGILWAVGNDNVVRAFDATDMTKPELWTSAMNAARDSIDLVGHFQFPTVVNGKLYVPTGSGKIAVYGLLSGQ
jgi:hypothetical protein